MKRKCTYILIGLLCFLGFSGEVNADSKEICVYKKTHDLPYAGSYYKKECTEALSTYKIVYDDSQKLPYQISLETVCSSDKSDGKNSVYKDKTQLVSGKAKTSFKTEGKGVFYGYFYDTMKDTACPKHIMFDKNGDQFVCFYNDDNGKKWCEDKKPKTSVGNDGYTTADVSNEISATNDSKNDEYSNIKNNVCSLYQGLEAANKVDCYMKFEYNPKANNIADMLIISSGTKEDNLKTIPQNQNYFTCGQYSVGQGEHMSYGNINVFLTNSDVGQSNKNVIVSSRNEFNKMFLDEWNANGCTDEIIKISNIGDSSDGRSKNNFYALFKAAAQDCIENGCDKIDVDGFGSLKPWTYDWENWSNINSSYDNCEGLLGKNLIALINDVLLYVKILIPVALIAFGLIDFVKAVFSSKEDDMKKAQVRFIKRLIMAVIVFIVPSIINLLMTAVDGIWAHINNSACNIWK